MLSTCGMLLVALEMVTWEVLKMFVKVCFTAGKT